MTDQLPSVLIFSLCGLVFWICLAYLTRDIARTVLSWSAREKTCFLLVIFIAGVALYTSPYTASNLPISDAVEYAVSAQRLVTQGSFDISLQNQSFPPRYAPWFPALLLAPAYAAWPADLGAGIYIIYGFAVLGVALAFCVGQITSGLMAGIVSAILLLVQPRYKLFSSSVLFDIPFSVLGVLCLYTLLSRNLGSNQKCFFGGVFAALAFGFRFTGIAFLLPVIWFTLMSKQIQHRSGCLLLATMPTFFVAILTLGYNTITFGQPFRNGYQFWCPVPYDFWNLTFSLDYLRQNLRILLEVSSVGAMAAFYLVCFGINRWQKGPHSVGAELASFLNVFLLLSGGVILGVHLFYFFPSVRFYLPIACLLSVGIGIFGGKLLEKYMLTDRHVISVLCFVLGLVGLVRVVGPENSPKTRIAIDQLAGQLAPNSIIISGINPAHLEAALSRAGSYMIVPISRQVEFASKLIAYRSVDCVECGASAAEVGHHKFIRTWSDHRADCLKACGATEAVEIVALEDLAWLKQQAISGRPIIIETSGVESQDLESLKAEFSLKPLGPELYAAQVLSKDV